MSPRSRLFLGVAIFAGWLCGAVELAGQSAAALPRAVGGSTSGAAGSSTPLTAGSYDAGGRRDPFVSLIVPKANPAAPRAVAAARPGAGLAGVAVSDVQLKGVVRSGTTFVAISKRLKEKAAFSKRPTAARFWPSARTN